MAPGDRARAEGRRHPQRSRARRVPHSARRPRTPGLRTLGAAAERLRRQPQGVAARGPRALLGGALLRAAWRPEPGGHQVLRRGDEVPERRQGGGGAVGAGEPVRRDGRFPRRPPGLLQADPRVPELRGGGARAAEAERAGELDALTLSGGARAWGRRLRFDSAPSHGWCSVARRARPPHRRSAGAPTPATHAATVLYPPPTGTRPPVRLGRRRQIGEQATQDTNALVRAAHKRRSGGYALRARRRGTHHEAKSRRWLR